MTTTPMWSLRYDPVEHRYWLEDRELISVTTALKEARFLDDRWFSDEASERGTYVHQACDLLDDDNLASYLPQVNGYIAAYQKFLHEAQPDWRLREHQVCDATLGYAGTLDRAGYLNGRWVLVDIKTGGPAPWHGLQLAAYGRLTPSPDTGARPARFDLYLTERGTYALIPQTDRTDEAEFFHALGTAQFRRRHGFCA